MYVLTCMHTCIYIHTYINTIVYTCIYTYVYIYAHVYVYAYAHVYVYACMYTCIHNSECLLLCPHVHRHLLKCVRSGWPDDYQLLALADTYDDKK